VANTPTSPQDATGFAVEKAAKARAKEVSARQEEIALSRKAEAISIENDIFDPATDKPILIDEIESVGVAVNNETVVIRTTADIEDMTFGVVNGVPQNYSFKQGQKYSVPRSLAIYLEGIGYVHNWR
jgi:hypothetical protein